MRQTLCCGYFSFSRTQLIEFWIQSGFGFETVSLLDFDCILNWNCQIGLGFEKLKSVHLQQRCRIYVFQIQVKSNFYSFAKFLSVISFFTKRHHVATNIKNCHSTLFVLHKVTKHLLTDFACCCTYRRVYMFSFLNLRSSNS